MAEPTEGNGRSAIDDVRDWAELVARHGMTAIPSMERYAVVPIEQLVGLRKALQRLTEMELADASGPAT